MFPLPVNAFDKRLAESHHDNYHRDVDTVVTQMRKEFWVHVQRRILSVIDKNTKTLIDPILGQMGEEREEKVTPTKKMAHELMIYESVLKGLNFEMETCWIEEGKLLCKFFMKPMAKKTLILKFSGTGKNIKVVALTQDVVSSGQEQQRVHGH